MDDVFPTIATWKGVPVDQLTEQQRTEMFASNLHLGGIVPYRPQTAVRLGGFTEETVIPKGRWEKMQAAVSKRMGDHMMDALNYSGGVTNVVLNPRQQGKAFTMESLNEAIEKIKDIPNQIAREREQEAMAELPGFGAF